MSCLELLLFGLEVKTMALIIDGSMPVLADKLYLLRGFLDQTSVWIIILTKEIFHILGGKSKLSRNGGGVVLPP